MTIAQMTALLRLAAANPLPGRRYEPCVLSRSTIVEMIDTLHQLDEERAELRQTVAALRVINEVKS